MIMIGYKGFDEDFKCRGFQYEVGKTYTYIGGIKICERGFHFCKRLNNVLTYYPRFYFSFDKQHTYWRTRNRYAIVEALGRYITDDKSKYVTDKIRIIKELSEEEMHEILLAEEADMFKRLLHMEGN